MIFFSFCDYFAARYPPSFSWLIYDCWTENNLLITLSKLEISDLFNWRWLKQNSDPYFELPARLRKALSVVRASEARPSNGQFYTYALETS